MKLKAEEEARVQAELERAAAEAAAVQLERRIAASSKRAIGFYCEKYQAGVFFHWRKIHEMHNYVVRVLSRVQAMLQNSDLYLFFYKLAKKSSGSLAKILEGCEWTMCADAAGCSLHGFQWIAPFNFTMAGVDA